MTCLLAFYKLESIQVYSNTMICNKCNKEKQPSFFPWKYKNKVRNNTCKVCQRIYDRAWYLKNRAYQMTRVHEKTKTNRKRADEFIYQYLLSHPCMGCAEKDPMVLTFDHLNPSKKRRDVSTMRSMGYSLKTIQTEIDKCQVLCFNCHVKKHRRNTRLGAIVSQLD